MATDRCLPILIGDVPSVSADSLQDERTGLSHFTTRIVVPDSQVELLRQARGPDTGIRPGVPVRVTVRLKPRAALQYMLDPSPKASAEASRNDEHMPVGHHRGQAGRPDR